MSAAKVREYLRQWGLQDRLQEFDTSSATVEEAALAVGCEPRRIAKTISFIAAEQPVLVVMAGDAKIDNAKYKAVFHQKATMIPREKVEELTGFQPGGVSPFALPEGLNVYLDESLKRFEIVYPAGGSGQSAVELSLKELETASKAIGWVDIGKIVE